MDERERQMHLRAGKAYGREATCGMKVNYAGEASAVKAASHQGEKYKCDLECYPCFWCDG